jgi:putative oligomerization/nucleic acid binding protein
MPGLLRGIVRTAAIAGTATAVSNRVSRRQAGRWARHDAEQQQVYAQQEADAPEDAGPPADDMDDKLAQLERLGNLKERGVLSEAEFAEQKQRILSG